QLSATTEICAASSPQRHPLRQSRSAVRRRWRLCLWLRLPRFRSCRVGLTCGSVTVTRLLGRKQLHPDLLLDLAGNLLVLLQEQPSIILPLANAAALVAVPGTRFLDDTLGATQVDDFPFA